MTQTLLRLQGISKAFSDRTILHNVDLQIMDGDRVGLIGPNGAGKSTLLNIVTGTEMADRGLIDWIQQPCSLHYMTQSRDEAQPPLHPPGWGSGVQEDGVEGDGTTAMMSKQLRLPEDIASGDRKALAAASGGERTKRALVKAFSRRAELLILDEPTNHLDIDGIEWLIREVNRYPGAVLLVSHDRYFLDRTVQQILMLQNGQSRSYSGNYSDYVRERNKERLAAQHLFETQQKEQARIESEITQLKQWATSAHRLAGKQGTAAERRQMGLKQYQRAKAKKLDQRVKSHIKRLEKLRTESAQKPKDESVVFFGLANASRHGKWLIEANDLEKSFGTRALFKQSSFFIGRGERIGLIGPNGCGKTTLIRMILGDETVSAGKLWISPSAKIAYLAQDDTLPAGDTILRMTERLSPDDKTRFRTMLANMEFEEPKLRTPVTQLSLGERTRVKLAWLILHDHNLLILDEPTNHLDVVSREELERALTHYDGTLLVVTHDRYFLQNLCDKALLFTDGQVQRVIGWAETETPGSTAFGGGLKRGVDPEVRMQSEKMKERNGAKQRRKSGSMAAGRQTDAAVSQELMILETQIARLLGELGGLTPNQPQYQACDLELNQLMHRRRELLTTK